MNPFSPPEYERIWPIVEKINGWLSYNEAVALSFFAALAIRDVGGAAVEIGGYKGRSTVAIGLALGGMARLHAYDPGSGIWVKRPRETHWGELVKNIEDSGLSNAVELNRIDERMNEFQWSGGPIGFAFIDGDHGLMEVRRDTALIVPHVPPGGVIAFHDFQQSHFPGVFMHVKQLVERFGWQMLFRCETLAVLRRPREEDRKELKLPPAVNVFWMQVAPGDEALRAEELGFDLGRTDEGGPNAELDVIAREADFEKARALLSAWIARHAAMAARREPPMAAGLWHPALEERLVQAATGGAFTVMTSSDLERIIAL